MPKGAKFLVTTDSAENPHTARTLLRKTDDAHDNLTDALREGIGQLDGDSFDLPEGAVLLMIGNTQELQEAIAASGLSYIESASSNDPGVWRHNLTCYFVRMQISGFGPLKGQTDTLLAIGSPKYWSGKDGYFSNDYWHQLADTRGDGAYRIYSGRNATVDDGTSLQWMIQECKRQDDTGWLPKQD